MVSIKKPYFAMACYVFHSYVCSGIIAESYALLIALLHSYKSYGYYTPTDYSLILFRSLHCYRPGLISLPIKLDVEEVNVFLSSTSNITPVQL